MYVIILSMDHSRSTIADLAIAKELGGVSLGEVRRTLFAVGGERNRLEKAVCACGKPVEDCEFWGGLVRLPRNERIEALLARSDSDVLVDSSKDLRHSRALINAAAAGGVDVVTVTIVRRFGEWRRSALESLKREGRTVFSSVLADPKFRRANLRLYMRRYWASAFLEWVVTNLRLIFGATRGGLLVLSSDDLATALESLQSRVPGGARRWRSHSVRGNRVRETASEADEVIVTPFSLPFAGRAFFRGVFEARQALTGAMQR